MAIYAIGLTPLLEMMMEIVINIKSAAFADDLTAIGMCYKLRQWWNYLSEEGPKIGYNPQPTKSWLIVKPQFEAKARQLFMGSNIQISTRGERHLGAVIGNTEFKQHYCQKLTRKWQEELSMLSKIGTIQPQAAYTCYTSGYQHKFSYYLRTIPGIEKYLAEVEQTI